MYPAARSFGALYLENKGRIKLIFLETEINE